MTVKELIEKLNVFSPEIKVLVDGYEDNLEDIASVKIGNVRHLPDAPWYSGEYEEAEKPCDDAFSAVILRRNRRETL